MLPAVPALRQPVTLANAPTTPSDTDGFYSDLNPPSAFAAIEPAAPGADGRTLTSLVTMRFHPEITIDTRIRFYDDILLRYRDLFVRGYQDIENRHAILRLLCEEVVP